MLKPGRMIKGIVRLQSPTIKGNGILVLHLMWTFPQKQDPSNAVALSLNVSTLWKAFVVSI